MAISQTGGVPRRLIPIPFIKGRGRDQSERVHPVSWKGPKVPQSCGLSQGLFLPCTGPDLGLGLRPNPPVFRMKVTGQGRSPYLIKGGVLV